ncbi:AAA family ATPase [Haloferula sp. BvORR071]|uniref:AAA family ATPase n=1 Tax=Haloferula sp. BvORR071 TaxID=1396141 RepID=UPI00054D03E5|nr:AAA family ATPase [Haloferula sp. BvORR071]
MISTLELRNFRGLEHVKFEELGRVNLIVGGNNAGKTSILEALVLLHGNSTQLTKLPSTFRQEVQNDNVVNFWSMLPRDKKWKGFWVSDGALNITAHISDKEVRVNLENGSKADSLFWLQQGGKLGLRGYGDGLSILSTAQDPPENISELFNRIAPLNPRNEDRIQDLIRRSIEPRLQRLRYAKPLGTKSHLVYADVGEGEMLPFTQLGQAFSRALQVYCEIFAKSPKILLVDEIENGLYYEGLEDYWRGLLEVLEDQNVQLFATTHSRECMEAAHRAAKTRDSYPIRYLRLDRRVDDPAKIVATSFGEEVMESAIQFNKEMR